MVLSVSKSGSTASVIMVEFEIDDSGGSEPSADEWEQFVQWVEANPDATLSPLSGTTHS